MGKVYKRKEGDKDMKEIEKEERNYFIHHL
jgi:hypothetical protein